MSSSAMPNVTGNSQPQSPDVIRRVPSFAARTSVFSLLVDFVATTASYGLSLERRSAEDKWATKRYYVARDADGKMRGVFKARVNRTTGLEEAVAGFLCEGPADVPGNLAILALYLPHEGQFVEKSEAELEEAAQFARAEFQRAR